MSLGDYLKTISKLGSRYVFTARKRSLRKCNIFTGVSLSTGADWSLWALWPFVGEGGVVFWGSVAPCPEIVYLSSSIAFNAMN